MKHVTLFFIGVLNAIIAFSQVTTNPLCFGDQDEITITYDAYKGTSGLVGASKVYMHSGVVTDSETSTSWQHVVGNWGVDDGIGEMTKVSGETNKWEITITPRTYYSVPAEEIIYRLGMVFRNADGSKEGKNDSNGDIFIDLAQDAVNLQLTSTNPLLVDNADIVPIEAITCSNAVFNLYIDNVLETTQSATNQFSYNYQVTQSAGSLVNVKLTAEVGSDLDTKEFSYTVRTATIAESRPTGIVDGINYNADPTKVTLSLLAPFKNSVYVVGDFTNWSIDPAYQMKQDGEHFWLEVTGLTSGQEYAYQYLIDETIWIADPYADKILDPDDKWIPGTTYPNLKEYPAGATHSNWYHNRAAVLQTNQTQYEWINTSFQKPEKEKLVIYELLVRDFLGEDNMNYKALIDTLGYLEDLGVNAIELMPIMEFGGNDSWGYNPTFMFAVDKAYGTKNDLKKFIDAAHSRGMAVILDMVMNQNDIPSPYAQMYFDFSSFKPTPDNPWFNVDAKHPYNVFSDINHESIYTKNWLDSINHYWLNEFKFDGYRFDLSKGFTQTNSGGDVGFWGQQDDTRIAILKRMADNIWTHTPDAYVMLEHFADNSEEKILSDYGMMLWGNAHWDYKDANLGNAQGRSLDWHYYKSRNWNNNYLISYMESHDEERQMYEMINHGGASGSYDIKDVSTALNRLKMSAAFFFTTPGPKMIWQFSEFGYDVSINENGRTGKKPTKWEYLDDVDRNNLLKTYQELIGLRNKYDVFTNGEFSWSPDGNLKSIHLSNVDTSVVLVANYGLINGEINPKFTSTGTWFDFFENKEIEVTNVNDLIFLKPGEFHIFTDKKLHVPEAGIINPVTGIELNTYLSKSTIVYPNPTNSTLTIEIAEETKINGLYMWAIKDVLGKEVISGSTSDQNSFSIDVGALPAGIYTFILANDYNNIKFIKE